ncbi:MAG: SusC/RagA family TonB-linked outer membrane protein [Bacteroidales bacterium]|nr:SusC/RagA family TonB-linked outer membrane protein [Bacteroidales bacterium]
MKRLKLILATLLSVTALLSGAQLSAIGKSEAESEGEKQLFRITFPKGVSTLQESFGSNAPELKALRNVVRDHSDDLLFLTSYASPDGNYLTNASLSSQRAASVKRFLVNEGFPEDQIIIRSAGEDFNGLRTWVASHSFDGKDQVLEILDGKAPKTAKKIAMKALQGGSVWTYLEENAMDDLRYVVVSALPEGGELYAKGGEECEPCEPCTPEVPVVAPVQEPAPVEVAKAAVEEEIAKAQPEPEVKPEPEPEPEVKPEPEPQRPVSAKGNITIKGEVVDKEGIPIPGASVYISGTTTGTVTDLDGEFSLVIPAATRFIKASCIGYEDADVAVSTARMHIALPDATNFLQEAVSIGYGAPKKIESLVGTVTTVNSETVKNAPSSSALDMLQGQVAGLQVLTSGGVAGDNSVSMKLHGVGSLTSSSEPLYIIDGVPSSSRSIMAMNPNDIESISILKDASATSIYGARAANGVVHIITKTGAYNNAATVTVRSQWGISTITDKSLYENMMSSSELARFWNISGIHSAQYVKETFYDQYGEDVDTKWYNYLQQFNNPQFQNDISITGGGQRVAYMIGASQFHQRGTAIGNVYDRYTLRSNIQGRPKDWLKIGLNTNLTYDNNIQNPNWSNSSSNRNYTSGALSYLTLPFYPAIDPETGKEYEVEYPGGMINHRTYMANRVAGTERLSISGALFGTIDFTPDLKFSSRAGVDGYISRGKGALNPSYSLSGGTGWRSRATTYNYTASFTNTLEYAHEFNQNHQFSVLVGHELIWNDYDYYGGSADGITNPALVLLDYGDPEQNDVYESQSQSGFRSFFAHADYTLFDKYIFDASFRMDASSRFGAHNRWAPFWSVGALWKIKKENFLRSVRWLDDLNFKVSYGTQGNASIGNYDRLALLGKGGTYYGTSSLYFGQPESPDLKWEQQALLTLALTGKVVNRVDFDIEWYHRKTTNMLMGVPIPATVGFGSQTRNVGGLLNTGVDLTLGVDIIRGYDYFLRFQTTFNYNRERITELFDGRERWEIEGTGVAWVVNHPVMYYFPVYAGVNRDNGKLQWYVPGENVDETTKGEVTEDFDEVALTQNTGFMRHAPINGGFSISGAWRGISLVCDFAYVVGKYMINNDAFFYANPNQFADDNQHKSVSNFWTENNRDAQWPDWRQGLTMQFDTHLIEDASFLRLKNLQVGYSLPKSLMSRQKVFKDVKFTFTGRNLLTLTGYTGIDPEDDTNVSLGLPANSKQYLFGLELTF